MAYDWSLDDPQEEETIPQGYAVPPEVLPEAEVETELSEVERRLEKAHFYRMLIKHDLISSDSAEAIEVEEEIQNFVRGQLAILLGMKTLPVAAVPFAFTDEEVEALKAVAAKVLQKPQVLAAKPPPKAATITPVSEKPAPVVAVRPPPEPVVRAAAPKAEPPPPRRRGRPPKSTPAPAPLQKSEGPMRPRTERPTAKEDDLAPGERIETVGGRRYKVVKRPVNDPATGKQKVGADGKPVFDDYKIDITPKTMLPGVAPFPSTEVMNAIESQRAAEVLAANPIANGLMATAMSMIPKE